MLTKFLFFILFIYFKILILTHRILKTHLTPEIQNPIKGFPSNIPRNGWKQEYLDLVGFGNGGTPLQDTIQEWGIICNELKRSVLNNIHCINSKILFAYMILEKSKLYSHIEGIRRDCKGYTSFIKYIMTLLKLH